MPSNRVYFPGLKVEEFIHPDEMNFRNELTKSKGYHMVVSKVSDVVAAYQFTNRLGVYTKLSRTTAPELYEILEDVIKILDVECSPDIYMIHSYTQILLPCGTEEPYLVISDYIAAEADTDMLYYLFGNAVAMIKADHVEITNITSYMPNNLWLTLPQISIKRYLHVADATSDRGGLLACQSFSAAARCHFLELGLPMNEVKRMFQDDDETAEYVAQYLKNVQIINAEDSTLTVLAEKWINLNYIEAPANRMLYELHQWYNDGYRRILKKYANMRGNSND